MRRARIGRISLRLAASIMILLGHHSIRCRTCIYSGILIFALVHDPLFALTFSISFDKTLCI